MKNFIVLALALCLACAFAGGPAFGQTKPDKNPQAGLLKKVAFNQNIGVQIPLDSTFHDESGASVALEAYAGRRPMILMFVYYECPMLCTLELNALARSLGLLSFDAGKEFDIVTISIDPTETPELAKRKKTGYLRRYVRPTAAAGWHFLTGDEPAIGRVAEAAGFRFAYDPRSKQYAHPAGLVVLTPEGKISKYFMGVDYPARDLKLALMEASKSRLGTITDQLLLYCFHYDPLTGQYNFAVMSLLRVAGVLTAVSTAVYMGLMFRRDLRARGSRGDRGDSSAGAPVPAPARSFVSEV